MFDFQCQEFWGIRVSKIYIYSAMMGFLDLLVRWLEKYPNSPNGGEK